MAQHKYNQKLYIELELVFFFKLNVNINSYLLLIVYSVK